MPLVVSVFLQWHNSTQVVKASHLRVDESEEDIKDQGEAPFTPIADQGSIAVASLTIGGFGVPQWQCRSGAELQEVTTVAGTGAAGHQNRARVQAHFCDPQGRFVLQGNRVSVADFVNHRIGVLSVDLQEVRTRLGRRWGHRDAAAQARFSSITPRKRS